MYLCYYCMFVQGSTENQFYWVESLIKNYNYNSSPLDHPLVTNCNMYFLPPINKVISISINSQEYITLYQSWTWTNHSLSLESNHISRTFPGITSQKNSTLILFISIAHVLSAQNIPVHPISAPLTYVSFNVVHSQFW